MKKNSREINVFSVSALDLFASALGAFIVMSMIFMVFFTMTSQSASQQENLQPALEQCEAQRAQAEGALAECQAQVENSVDASALAQCESQLAQCQEQLGGSVDASALAQCQSDLAAAQAQNADLQAQLEAASSAAGEMEAVNAELESCQRALKKTFVLVVASWESEDRSEDGRWLRGPGNNDVDLHVVDPMGREFYHGKTTDPDSAAVFEEDTIRGPGNEIWVHPNAEAGPYRICYMFYRDRLPRPSKPQVRGTIFWQEGKIKLPAIGLTNPYEKELPFQMHFVVEFLVDEEGIVSLNRSKTPHVLENGRC